MHIQDDEIFTHIAACDEGRWDGRQGVEDRDGQGVERGNIRKINRQELKRGERIREIRQEGSNERM